jgi:flavin-binding protein dodecin
MPNRVYKKVELVGTSQEGIEDAIRNAVSTASATLEHLDWFEVVEVRGHIRDGAVDHYQVVIKAGFRIEK